MSVKSEHVVLRCDEPGCSVLAESDESAKDLRKFAAKHGWRTVSTLDAVLDYCPEHAGFEKSENREGESHGL